MESLLRIAALRPDARMRDGGRCGNEIDIHYLGTCFISAVVKPAQMHALRKKLRGYYWNDSKV